MCGKGSDFVSSQASGIDPLQLTSSIREYGNEHQHGGYLAFLGDSSFYGDLGTHSHAPTMVLVCVESVEM